MFNQFRPRSDVISEFYESAQAIREKKNKIDDNIELSGVFAPLIFVLAWTFIGGAVLYNDRSVEGLLELLGIGVLVVLCALAVFISFRIIWSDTDVNYSKLAKKVFTKEKLENQDEYLLAEYKELSEEAQAVIRSKLQVSVEQVAFMSTLVNEGYKGSVKNLVTTVKSL